MSIIFRPTSFSTSEATGNRKGLGGVRKGGSLRHAHAQDDGVDERAVMELKILRAQLKAMRDEDENILKRIKQMDVDLRSIQQLCFSATPDESDPPELFQSDMLFPQHEEDSAATSTEDESSASAGSVTCDFHNQGDEEERSTMGNDHEKSARSSPHAVLGSSVEVDSVFGSPPPFSGYHQSSGYRDSSPPFSPPFSPPYSSGQRNMSFPMATPSARTLVAAPPHSQTDDGCATPLVHSAVSSLHRPLGCSSSFGESAFMNDLHSNSLMGDDLIAMFNEKSDAVKKELGLSQSSLASSSGSGGRAPMPWSSGTPPVSASPHPPRASSCAEVRCTSRPESPLVSGGSGGHVESGGNGTGLGRSRRSGAVVLSVSLSMVSSMEGGSHGLGGQHRARPSPSQSPAPYSPLNMKALLGGQAPTPPGQQQRGSPDIQRTSPNAAPVRRLSGQTSVGAMYDRREKLCRKSGSFGPDCVPQRSNSMGSAAVHHSHTGSADSGGVAGDEMEDCLSPLRRGSKAWGNNDSSLTLQEEQFLRGRLVTSPPELEKPAASQPLDGGAVRRGGGKPPSTTPTILSQKHRRQFGFQHTESLTVEVSEASPQHSGSDVSLAHDRSHSGVASPVSSPGSSGGHSEQQPPPSTNLVKTSHLSHSNSSLTSRKSMNAARFIGKFVRGGKKRKENDVS